LRNGKVTSHAAQEFTRLYNQGLTTHAIAQMFNITHRTVCGYLKKLGVELRRSGTRARAIPENIQLDENLAYILGVLGPGDGFIHKRSVALEVADKEFVEEFKTRIEKITGLQCTLLKIIKSKNPNHRRRYKTLLNSTEFIKFLANFGVSFREKDWRIPVAIKQAQPEIRAAYLRAFADSQGWVEARRVGLCVKNLVGLKEIQELLSSIGIPTSLTSHKKASRLYIGGRRNLEAFAAKVGFIIKRKREKLEKILASYKLYRTPTQEIDGLVPQMTQLRARGLSYVKIAKQLGISKPAVLRRRHLLDIHGVVIKI
jgi:replicative DNA helicase Mcm